MDEKSKGRKEREVGRGRKRKRGEGRERGRHEERQEGGWRRPLQ